MSALFDTKFAPKQTRRFILRCRGRCMKKPCQTVVAADCPVEDVQRYTRGFVGVPGSAVPYIARVANTRLLPDVWCVTHRWPLVATEVKGTVTDCPCDGRCTSAKGPNCDCSCGGANHGSDYL